MKDGIRGIVKTITDGLRDANMQYDWAEDAKSHGAHDLAMLHISEAKKRLDGAKEWYEKAMAMMPKAEHTELEEILMCHYKHWYRELREKVEAFHRG